MSSGIVSEPQQPSGNIDGVYHHTLTGWFVIDSIDRETELTLLVDGVKFLSTITNLPRSDVEKHLGFGATSGFSFELGELNNKKVVELTVLHQDSGYSFNGCTLNYCHGVSEHYDIIKGIFYPEFYRCRYGYCHLSNEEAFQEFLKFGIFNDNDPNPWFSNEYYRKHYPERVENGEVPLLCYLATESDLLEQPSNLFDPVFYQQSNPDLVNAHSLLWHYSKFGNNEGRACVDIELPVCITKEFEEIAAIEPLVAGSIAGLKKIVRYPYISKATYLPKILHETVGEEIKVVICVPFISRGGADLISTFLFKAYQCAFGKDKVLMLVTDRPTIDVPEWIDDGSQVIVLDEQSSFVNDEEKLNALHICLGRIAPEKIINVNSHTTWRLFERYGVQLSTVVDLYAFLFCFDYNIERLKVGYITQYLPSTLGCLKSVFFDNEHVVDDIKRLFGFSQKEMSKLHTVYVPDSAPYRPVSIKNREGRDAILWAGRLSLQKRPDILVSIAQEMPNQSFEVYGPAGNSEYSKKIIDGEYSNIIYRGVYNTFEEVDFDRYFAFLNTSEWDGLPTILIQMLAMGMPVVTSSVGGVSELVSNTNGWLVEDLEDIDAYIVAIRRIMILQDEVEEKVANGLAVIAERHTWNVFYKKLELLNAFKDRNSLLRETIQFKDRRKAA